MRTTKPYLIAEMGVNFYDTARVMNISPLEAAKRYIDAAADAGIDCAKFQSYKAGTIVSKTRLPTGIQQRNPPRHSMSFS
jgi:N-acetylneuraminate synthase